MSRSLHKLGKSMIHTYLAVILMLGLFAVPVNAESEGLWAQDAQFGFVPGSEKPTSVTLWWDQAQTEEGNELEYEILKSVFEEGEEDLEVVEYVYANPKNSQRIYYTLTELKPETEYTFYIRAVNDNASELSSSIEVETTMNDKVHFEDKLLKERVISVWHEQSEQGGGIPDDIYATQMAEITHLSSLFTEIDVPLEDLTGLEYAVNLEFLRLGGNNIIDLEPLSFLSHLKYLDLRWNNKLDDISPLLHLYNLAELHLNRTNVTDLRPINDSGAFVDDSDYLGLKEMFLDLSSGTALRDYLQSWMENHVEVSYETVSWRPGSILEASIIDSSKISLDWSSVRANVFDMNNLGNYEIDSYMVRYGPLDSEEVHIVENISKDDKGVYIDVLDSNGAYWFELLAMYGNDDASFPLKAKVIFSEEEPNQEEVRVKLVGSVPAGESLAGIPVYAFDNERSTAEAISDSNGIATFNDLSYGEWRFATALPGTDAPIKVIQTAQVRYEGNSDGQMILLPIIWAKATRSVDSTSTLFDIRDVVYVMQKGIHDFNVDGIVGDQNHDYDDVQYLLWLIQSDSMRDR